MIYALAVTKNMGSIDYRYTRKTARELADIIRRCGLTHQSLRDATEAAQEISRHPLVLRVVMVRVQEAAEGVWRNGAKSC